MKTRFSGFLYSKCTGENEKLDINPTVSASLDLTSPARNLQTTKKVVSVNLSVLFLPAVKSIEWITSFSIFLGAEVSITGFVAIPIT